MGEHNEQLLDIPKDIQRSARSLARMTNLPVGIGYDASITVGNVTLSEYMVTDSTCAPEDLAMLVEYYSDEGYAEEGLTPTHVMFSISPADEPGLEAWDKQCLIEIERPEHFAKIIAPPSKTAKAINRLLFGY